jgi:signal transduction histidine kinase
LGVSEFAIAVIFFIYGLAFFSLGLATAIEADRAGERRVRRGLLALSAFGILHGTHEWYDMFEILGLFPLSGDLLITVVWIRIILLALSFAILAYFGFVFIPGQKLFRNASLIIPTGMFLIWFGAVWLVGRLHPEAFLPHLGDVLARYLLAIPGAVLAAIGLRKQCVAYHDDHRFLLGKNCTYAAYAFLVYGLVGQLFVRETVLPPSNILNQDLFLELFRFPVQLLRALAAVAIAFFIIRLLRAFEKEIRSEIARLQRARLDEARRREALRGELLKRVVGAQESERQRIARELHDETGQGLTAVGMGLRGLAGMLTNESEQAKGTLRHLEALVDYTLNEIQRIIADLRPSHLDDLGLPAALRWYAGEVAGRTNTELHVAVDGEQREIDTDVKLTLFRVTQEALTNVVKHADADNTWITLQFKDDEVSITVEDDGSGFNVDWINLPTQETWGLIGMQERATLLGGRFALESEIGEGTKIQIVIPYNGTRDIDEEDEIAVGG